MCKILTCISIIVIYVLGGITVEALFNSHPITALFGYLMGVVTLSVFQQEKNDD